MSARSRKKATIAATAAIAVAAAVGIPATGAAKPRHHAPKPKVVKVLDNYYSPLSLTVNKGTSIRWVWGLNGDTHNVRLATGPDGVKKSVYKSPTGIVGIHFQRKLLKAGTYRFFCSLHSTEMRMKVVVKNR